MTLPVINEKLGQHRSNSLRNLVIRIFIWENLVGTGRCEKREESESRHPISRCTLDIDLEYTDGQRFTIPYKGAIKPKE